MFEPNKIYAEYVDGMTFYQDTVGGVVESPVTNLVEYVDNVLSGDASIIAFIKALDARAEDLGVTEEVFRHSAGAFLQCAKELDNDKDYKEEIIEFLQDCISYLEEEE